MTDYIVFRKEPETHNWKEWKLAPSSRSARAAIQAVVNQDVDAGDVNLYEYAAVPARSWKPVTVKVETKTALRFS